MRLARHRRLSLFVSRGRQRPLSVSLPVPVPVPAPASRRPCCRRHFPCCSLVTTVPNCTARRLAVQRRLPCDDPPCLRAFGSRRTSSGCAASALAHGEHNAVLPGLACGSNERQHRAVQCGSAATRPARLACSVKWYAGRTLDARGARSYWHSTPATTTLALPKAARCDRPSSTAPPHPRPHNLHKRTRLTSSSRRQLAGPAYPGLGPLRSEQHRCARNTLVAWPLPDADRASLPGHASNGRHKRSATTLFNSLSSAALLHASAGAKALRHLTDVREHVA